MGVNVIMGKRIQEILREERRKQPIEELERKWEKAKGRHSNAFWCDEWLDLAYARAKKWYEFLCEGK